METVDKLELDNTIFLDTPLRLLIICLHLVMLLIIRSTVIVFPMGKDCSSHRKSEMHNVNYENVYIPIIV